MRLCKCGCNRIIPEHYHYTKNYIKGHLQSMAKTPCLCGCGQLANPPHKYCKWHSSRDPVIRNKIREAQADPEFKKEMNRKRILGWTPEKRLANSIRNKKRMAITSNRKELSDKLKAYWKGVKDRDAFRGENSCHWRGGISRKGYCKEFRAPFKEEIKALDEFECKNPYCYSGKNLSVHHIDYVKTNCVWLNLITVCRSCNTRANYHRRYWKRLYKRIRKFGFNERCMFEFGA